MAYDATFTPKGSTVLLGVTVLQIQPTNVDEQATSMLVRCLVTGYFAWLPGKLGDTAPSITVTAPTAGVPSANTIGMSIGQVQTFQLPQNAWFKSSVAAGFEFTPGEGV